MFPNEEITAEERVCRACVLQAIRFATNQQRAREQEEADEAVAAAAFDDEFQQSGSHTPEENPIDPLGDVPEEDAPHLEDEQEVALNQPDDHLNQQENAQHSFPVSGIRRISHTSRYCIISGCHNNDLHRIYKNIRYSILINQDIYIPDGVRVCGDHLASEVWNDLISYCRPTHDTFTEGHNSEMVDLLRKFQTHYLDFEKLDTIEDAVFQFYIGFNKIQFQQILEETPSLSNFKKPQRTLAIQLCKLHTGDSNERLSSIFQLSPQRISQLLKQARTCLKNDFVPKHLGLDHIYAPGKAFTYREQLRDRILRIPYILFSRANSPVISICDGTYFYLQKSSNYKFQRQTFSHHKNRHLIKVFLIVCPDGYIIEAFGPYEANKSDAEIMKDLIAENEENPFHYFFEEGDVFIVDRGFRDVIDKMADVGYQAYIPATKEEHERQLTAQKANDSRKVTLCRWVVETINGRLKNQFRQLRTQNVNLAVPHLFEEIQIACALINAFGKRLVDHELTDQFINEIHLKHDAPNRLSELVIQNNFNFRRAAFHNIDTNEGFEELVIQNNFNFRRAAFHNIDTNEGFEVFPRLEFNELLEMSLGPYQVQQARSYYSEHIKTTGNFRIEVYEDNNIDYDLNEYGIVANAPCLVRAKIQSRHQNHRVYFVYILLDSHLNGRNKIIEHYCNCLVGKRTLGCCAHVMTIIWYMAWARHQETPLLHPAAFLDVIFNADVINDSDDELM